MKNVTITNKKRSKALELAFCFLWQAITLKPVVVLDCLELDGEAQNDL